MNIHAHVHSGACGGPEEGAGTLGIGDTDKCGLPCDSWQLNPGPLQEQ